MSPRAAFSPSRWSPDYFKYEEENLACPKMLWQKHDNFEASNLGHNKAGHSQTIFSVGTDSVISKLQRPRSPSPALSNRASVCRSLGRSRTHSCNRKGKREFVSGWDRRFPESPPMLNSEDQAAGKKSLSDTRYNVKDSSYVPSQISRTMIASKDHANDDRVKNEALNSKEMERGWKRGQNSERRGLDHRSTATPPNQGSRQLSFYSSFRHAPRRQ